MTPRPRVQPATTASGPQIGSYDWGQHIVVSANGEIDAASAPKLRDELVAAIDRRSARLVIDLTGATFASATCLDVLMGALRAADIIGGGDVRLVGAGRRLRELLAQAGLQPVFVDGSVNDAVTQSVRDRTNGVATRQGGAGAGAPNATTEKAALRAEIDRLRETMQGDAVIEQAKGMLMLRYAVDDEQAFALLRSWSEQASTPLHAVADTLVNAICRGVRSSDHDTRLVHWLELQLRHGPDGRAAAHGRGIDGAPQVGGAGTEH